MVNVVLVVTPESADAEVLQSVLPKAKDGPFKIEWVTHLSDALERLALGDVDVVLADLGLPDSKGIETFDQLFSAAPEIPLMLITGDDEDALATEAVLRGAQGYLSKGNFRNALLPQALRNIILRKAVEASLFQEKVFTQAILDSIGDGVISTDTSGCVTFLNAAAERLTGWSMKEAADLPADRILRLVDGRTRASVENIIELVLRENKGMDLQEDFFWVRRDGYEIAIEGSTSPVHCRRKAVMGAVMVFRDIGPARATMAQKLTHFSQHDFLTNLPNRVLLNDRLTQAIELAKQNSTQLVVMYLDLDNFKHINDSLGHAIGDNLIKLVAQRLASGARSSDTVSRPGGDEFILLALGMDTQRAMHTAQELLAAVAPVNKFSEHELYITASIGISLYPDDGRDAETLIKNAETAMYHAKKMGRNNFQFFNREMNVRAVERQVIEAELRRALQRDEFLLYYQPQVNLESRTITGAEALIRWEHPERGLLQPLQFISIAEECGLIVPMGRWVLREACMQAKRWQNAGLMRISIGVNVSVSELSSADFLEEVRDTLTATGFDPGFLELELTESVLMHNAERSRSILDELKKMGMKLAIDDFGTGYSSLSYLQQFPIDVLKIDQSFVNRIVQPTSDSIIVRAIIGMGTSLRQRIIAEGIETETQYAFLKAQHCEEGQGYFFSRPLVPDQFARLLETGLPKL